MLDNEKILASLSFVVIVLFIGIVVFGFSNWPPTSSANADKKNTLESTIITKREENKLQEKVLVTFGDSVTEFGHYPNVIARNTGMRVYNVGFGGTRMAYHTDENYDAFSMTKLADAIVSGDFTEQEKANEVTGYTNTFALLKNIDFNDVDIITIFYGTNDYMGTSKGVVPLGKEDDLTRETFIGAMNYIVDTISETYPDIEIVFVTPTWRMNSESLGGGDADTSPNADGVFLIEYVDAIIDFADSRNLPSLDLYRTSGINAETKDIYLSDSVHPTHEGYELIGNKISDFLKVTYNE